MHSKILALLLQRPGNVNTDQIHECNVGGIGNLGITMGKSK